MSVKAFNWTYQTFCELIFVFPSVQQQRIEIQKLRQGPNLILGFSIGGGIDQDPGQNPYTEDKTDKVSLYIQTGDKLKRKLK